MNGSNDQPSLQAPLSAKSEEERISQLRSILKKSQNDSFSQCSSDGSGVSQENDYDASLRGNNQRQLRRRWGYSELLFQRQRYVRPQSNGFGSSANVFRSNGRPLRSLSRYRVQNYGRGYHSEQHVRGGYLWGVPERRYNQYTSYRHRSV